MPVRVTVSHGYGEIQNPRTQNRASHPKRKAKLRSVKSAVGTILSKSMLTGIPQIVNAGSLPRKIIKSAVFVLCLVGFTYQMWSFMSIYWKYPTTVDVQLEYPQFMEMPALTFCSNNGISRWLFCRKNPDSCMLPENMTTFCAHFPIFCLPRYADMLKFPKMENLQDEYKVTEEDLLTLAQRRKDIIPYIPLASPAIKKDENVEIFGHMTVEDTTGKRKICHTFHIVVESEDGEAFQVPVQKGSNSFYTGATHLYFMYINFRGEDNFRLDRETGGQMQIHSPYTYVNPFITGFALKPGRSYVYQLTAIQKKLLPSPYDSNCADYKALWMKMNNSGPLSQEMCLERCSLMTSVEQCKCAKFAIIYPHNYSICVTAEELACVQNISNSQCRLQCLPPCHSVNYEYSINEKEIEGRKIKDFSNYLNEQILPSQTILSVFIRRPEIVSYTYKPKYETIEAFGYLGGYVGIWLGISLIAVLDFMESLMLMMKLACLNLIPSRFLKKKKKKHLKMKRIQVQERSHVEAWADY